MIQGEFLQGVKGKAMIKRHVRWLPAWVFLCLVGLCGCGSHDTPVDWHNAQLVPGLEAAFSGWAQDAGVKGCAIRVYSPGNLDWQFSLGIDTLSPETPFQKDSSAKMKN